MSNKFKDLIDRHQLSQSELARIIEVSRPTAIKILSGEREIRMSEADKLAMNLGISVTEIFGETSEVEVVLKKKSAKVNKEKKSESVFLQKMSISLKMHYSTSRKKLEPCQMLAKLCFTRFYIFVILIITKNTKSS